MLIIDDDPVFSHITRSFFLNNGWETEVSQNSEQAFNKLTVKDFHFVLVDTQIKTESGIDILKSLKKNYSYVNVLICTAYGTIENAGDIKPLGFAPLRRGVKAIHTQFDALADWPLDDPRGIW